MKTKNIIILPVILMMAQYALTANDQPPQVNEKSPDFTFTDIRNYKQPTASLRDFRGRWLVIDAWSVGCISCIAEFPRVNELHKQMQDRATFILVGKEHALIRGWYEKYRVNKNLVLPYTFDSTIFKLYRITTVPRTIIIDPQGVIRVITSDYLTKEKLEQVFAGHNPYVPKKSPGEDMPFNEKKPLGIHDNGSPDDQFLFRSLLTKWTYGQGDFTNDFGDQYNWSNYLKNGFQLMAADRQLLYRIAFVGRFYIYNTDTALYGKYWLNPIFEVRDTTVLQSDYTTGKNMFCYSLVVPDSLATNEYLQKRMQKDLDNYFNYTTTIEEREMPVWEAVASRNLEHLRTRGGEEIGFSGLQYSTTFREQNMPIAHLFSVLSAIFQEQPPIINKTGVDFNIDIELDCLPTDLNAIIKELDRKGIKMYRTTKKMKVVVVRDADLSANRSQIFTDDTTFFPHGNSVIKKICPGTGPGSI